MLVHATRLSAAQSGARVQFAPPNNEAALPIAWNTELELPEANADSSVEPKNAETESDAFTFTVTYAVADAAPPKELYAVDLAVIWYFWDAKPAGSVVLVNGSGPGLANVASGSVVNTWYEKE